MAKNSGTLIGAPVRPNDSLDLYPVAFQSEIKGGHHSRATIQERNAIGVQLREAGMTCFVKADKNTYELANDLVTWIFVKGSGNGSTAPGSGGDSSSVTIISGNFGVWLPVDNLQAAIVEQCELCYKTDLVAFPSRAITYLQGQFYLANTFAGTSITLGNIPLNSRPTVQLKKYLIVGNTEMYLIVELNGDVKLISKDGFNLPIDNAEAPYYIELFYKPEITTEAPTTYTATRTESFALSNCGNGYQGSGVEFTKTYNSTIDQATADSIAANDSNFATEGQAFANDPANGATCTVYQIGKSSISNTATQNSIMIQPEYDGGQTKYFNNVTGTQEFDLPAGTYKVLVYATNIHGNPNVNSARVDCGGPNVATTQNSNPVTFYGITAPLHINITPPQS